MIYYFVVNQNKSTAIGFNVFTSDVQRRAMFRIQADLLKNRALGCFFGVVFVFDRLYDGIGFCTVRPLKSHVFREYRRARRGT